MRYLDRGGASDYPEQAIDEERERIRFWTPLVREDSDSVRIFDPSEDSRVHSVALSKEEAGVFEPQEKVIPHFEDGERFILEHDGTYNHNQQVTFKPDIPLPTGRIRGGKLAQVRGVTERCEAWPNDEEPVFREYDDVVLVEDVGAVDGVRAAPAEIVDSRYSTHHLGMVPDLGMHRSEVGGFDVTIPVELQQ